MNNQPLVSVLMTSYNREKYISQAIESVLASTYKNFELIIVDDKSKDSTVEIAKKFSAIDNRIRVYVNEVNLGDYPNRNQAASYAKGKYLKYVDADDLIYPHGLEVMVRCMEQFPDAGLGICSKENVVRPYPELLYPRDTYLQKFFGDGIRTNAPLSTIIKRSVFEELGGFSGERYVGDGDMWLRISARYAIVKMMPGLVFWRAHDSQETSAKGLFHISDYKMVMRNLKSPNCPLTLHEIEILEKRLKYAYTVKCLKLAISGNIRLAREYFQEIGVTKQDLLNILPKIIFIEIPKKAIVNFLN